MGLDRPGFVFGLASLPWAQDSLELQFGLLNGSSDADLTVLMKGVHSTVHVN